ANAGTVDADSEEPQGSPAPLASRAATLDEAAGASPLPRTRAAAEPPSSKEPAMHLASTRLAKPAADDPGGGPPVHSVERAKDATPHLLAPVPTSPMPPRGKSESDNPVRLRYPHGDEALVHELLESRRAHGSGATPAGRAPPSPASGQDARESDAWW